MLATRHAAGQPVGPPLSPAVPYPAVRPYRGWKHTWIVAVVLLAFIVARLSEVVMQLRFIKPVLLSLVVSTFLLVTKLPRPAWRAALKNPTTRWLVIYLAIAVIGVPFAFYRSETFNATKLMVPSTLLLVLAILLVEPTRDRLDRVTAGFVAAVTLVSAIWIVRGGDQARLGSGASYDPNDLAAMAALTFPLALGLLGKRRTMLYRLIGIGGALVALVMLARTASRGGMIAFVVSMAVYTLALRPGRFFAMLLVSAMAGAGLWQFGPPMFRERAESLFHLENDYNSSSEGGRIAIWKRGLGLVRDYPVFGVGVGNFGNADGARRVAKGQLGRWFTAHNTYLQAAAEMGIPGGIVLLCLLGRAARDSWPLYRRRSRARSPNIGQRPEYLASLVAFCTSGFFLSHAVNPLLFAVVGLCGLAGLVARAAPAAVGVPALPGYPGYVPDAPAAAPRGLIGPRRRLMRGGLAAFQ